MATDELIYQPPEYDWHSEDQHETFTHWKGQVTLALEASNINREIWYATIIGFLGKEGYKWWSNLKISTQEGNRKDPDKVFKATENTLEHSTSYWNYIDEMNSDIRQGEHETADQLDQCIKQLVEKYQYQNQDEKKVHQTDLLFHVTKHLEVKKWVRQQKDWKDVTYKKLLEHSKQYECTVKDFNWHKASGGVAMAATIDEIKTFKPQYNNGYKGKGSYGKACGKCAQSHP